MNRRSFFGTLFGGLLTSRIPVPQQVLITVDVATVNATEIMMGVDGVLRSGWFVIERRIGSDGIVESRADFEERRKATVES